MTDGAMEGAGMDTEAGPADGSEPVTRVDHGVPTREQAALAALVRAERPGADLRWTDMPTWDRNEGGRSTDASPMGLGVVARQVAEFAGTFVLVAGLFSVVVGLTCMAWPDVSVLAQASVWGDGGGDHARSLVAALLVGGAFAVVAGATVQEWARRHGRGRTRTAGTATRAERARVANSVFEVADDRIVVHAIRAGLASVGTIPAGFVRATELRRVGDERHVSFVVETFDGTSTAFPWVATTDDAFERFARRAVEARSGASVA